IPPRLAVVAAEFREVVPGVPPFDEHAPIGHLHRADRDVRLPLDGRPPVESHRDPFRREERSIAGMQAVDGEVLDQDVAGQEMDAKRSDAQRALDVPGRLLFRRVARHRAEIDGHRHHDGRREQRDDHRQAEGGVSKNAARYARSDLGMAVFCRRSRPTWSVFWLLRHASGAQRFEQGHRITTMGVTPTWTIDCELVELVASGATTTSWLHILSTRSDKVYASTRTAST